MRDGLGAQALVEPGNFAHDQRWEFFTQPGFDFSDDEGVE